MSTGRTLPQDAPPFRLSPRGRTIALSHDPDCVVALKALGEDTRVRIMGLLIDAPLDVTEIARRVGVSQYNVSKHLRILREAGLLQVKKSGRRHLYAPPDAIRSRATESSVLDLGCCSFKFDQSSPETARPAPTRRRRRPGHDDTKSMATKITKYGPFPVGWPGAPVGLSYPQSLRDPRGLRGQSFEQRRWRQP